MVAAVCALISPSAIPWPSEPLLALVALDDPLAGFLTADLAEIGVPAPGVRADLEREVVLEDVLDGLDSVVAVAAAFAFGGRWPAAAVDDIDLAGVDMLMKVVKVGVQRCSTCAR